MRAIRRFGAGRPDLELRLTVQQQDDALRDLGAGRLHLAVCWTGPPPGELLDAAPLVTVPLVGVVRRDDPLAGAPSLPRRALAGRTVALYEPSRETRAFYDFFLGAFGAPGDGPRVVHVPVLDDAQEAMLDAVESAGGFTLSVAGELERSRRERLAARPFDPPLAADVVVIWPRARRPDLVGDLTDGVAAAMSASSTHGN